MLGLPPSSASIGCPCGSGRPLPRCCQAVHRDHAAADTAERLMRARYSAYVRGDVAFLLRSWHPEGRPTDLVLGPTRWLGLTVHSIERGAVDDTEGWVEFTARYRDTAGEGALDEYSRFVREDGRWFYVGEGVRPTTTRTSGSTASRTRR